MALSAPAADVQSLEVTNNGARHAVSMTVELDAEPATAYAVLTRFENLPDINPAVQRVQIRSRTADQAVLETDVRVCVLWFCKVLVQVQDMTQAATSAGGTLTAAVRPDESNLRFGHAHWQIEPCNHRTCLEFNAEIEPDFWIPPVIGPWVVRRKLEQEALQTSEGIERLAAELR